MIQRHRASETGSVFVKRNEEDRDMTMEELRNALAEGNRGIEAGLTHFGGKIRGTAQWKYAKRLELSDMIEFLGLPTFFVTFSAADNHWPDLQHLMKRHEEGELPDDVQIDESGRNGRVVRNPHMVGSFFGKRIQIFLEEVIKTENLAHHWYIWTGGPFTRTAYCG